MKKPIDVQAMFPQFAQVSDAALRQKTIEIWNELWAMSEFEDIETVPTSGDIPSPNLPHSRSVLTMCLSVADAFERYHGVTVDRDVLIVAAILQDASKVVEYRPTAAGGVERTDIGGTYGHAFWVTMLAAQKGLPSAISHILITHSPQAAKFPQSLEGKIIYYVDQLDVIAIHGDHWIKESIIRK
jgi:hypothetical protein